jgi:N-acetylneuraminic acid mutarotase
MNTRSAAVGLAVLLGGCADDPLVGPAGPIACPLDAQDTSGACWEVAAPYGSGTFPEEWRPGTFPLGLVPVLAFDGALWMVGRTGAWSSSDGLTWTPHRKDDWGARIGQTVVFFGGQLWMFGGLAYDERVFLDDVWRSPDGEHWQRAGTAAWPPRAGATVVAFRDRLWLLGGGVHAAADRSPDGFVNDVWRSDDGVSWTLVTAAAPWPASDYPRAVGFGDALWLLGGQGHAELWRSAEGETWTRLAESAPWRARFDQGVQLFDGRLWVFGGEPAPRQPRQSGTAIQALNDIWYSADGVRWERQAEHGPWSPRSGGTSAVFRGALWLFSGKHTGAADNWGGDIWIMRPAR